MENVGTDIVKLFSTEYFDCCLKLTTKFFVLVRLYLRYYTLLSFSNESIYINRVLSPGDYSNILIPRTFNS